MMKCPFCEFEAEESKFKLLREPWRFRFYTVRRLECPMCKGIFQYYTGVSSTGKKSVFTIRIKPRPPAIRTRKK